MHGTVHSADDRPNTLTEASDKFSKATQTLTGTVYSVVIWSGGRHVDPIYFTPPCET